MPVSVVNYIGSNPLLMELLCDIICLRSHHGMVNEDCTSQSCLGLWRGNRLGQTGVQLPLCEPCPAILALSQRSLVRGKHDAGVRMDFSYTDEVLLSSVSSK